MVLFTLASTSLHKGNMEVSRPGWWLFYYSLLTSVNMVLGILLAVTRITLQLLLSILDISRVDRSLFPYWRSLDSGYTGFYGMVLMQEGFARYYKRTKTDEEQFREEERAERAARKG